MSGEIHSLEFLMGQCSEKKSAFKIFIVDLKKVIDFQLGFDFLCFSMYK